MQTPIQMITLLNGDTWEKDALLAKMTDDDFYYGYLGKNAMSSSNIKLLTKSPKHYKFITTYGQETNSSALQVGHSSTRWSLSLISLMTAFIS